MPTQNEIRQPTPKLRSVKVLMSTIGSRALSSPPQKGSPETTQIAAQTATEVSSSHCDCGPSSSTYSSVPRKPAMNASPHQSKCSSSAKFGSAKAHNIDRQNVSSGPG